MKILNPIEETARDQWCFFKWEYMERVQEREPNLWLGWYDLISVAPISPNGGMYNAYCVNQSVNQSARKD